MSATRSFGRRVVLGAVLALGGCVEVDGMDYVIDLDAHRATVTYQNLHGDEDDDLKELMTKVLPGDTLKEPFPRAKIESRELVEDGETLDIRLSIPVSSPSDLSISRWDNDHPYRLCPAKGMVFTSANADARDADGCLIWANGAKVLRAHAEMLKQATTAHLLKRYKEWVAKGKPAFDAH